MTNLLRRVRAALGIGVAWSLPWAAASALARAAIIYFLVPLPPDLSRVRMALVAVLTNGISGAVVGFVTGSAFAIILSVAERKRTLSRLSARRFSLWGAVAGGTTATALATLASLNGVGNLLFAISSIGVSVGMGAACAALTLRLARAKAEAPSQDAPGVQSSDSDALPSPNPLDDLHWTRRAQAGVKAR